MTFTHKSKAWQAKRLTILARDFYTCKMCGASLTNGRKHGRAAVVDHLEPVTLSPAKAMDDENLQAVCKLCHDSTCASIEAQHDTAEAIRAAKLAWRPVGLDGYPA